MWCSGTGYIGSTWREWVDNFIPFQEIDIAFFYTPFQVIVLHLNSNPSFLFFQELNILCLHMVFLTPWPIIS